MIFGPPTVNKRNLSHKIKIAGRFRSIFLQAFYVIVGREVVGLSDDKMIVETQKCAANEHVIDFESI